MVQLRIQFPAGSYSANKENIKSVFKILDYKYVSGNQRGDTLVCLWKRKVEKQTIKGIFYGSGQRCEFIVECNDDEVEIFKGFEIPFKATVNGYVQSEEQKESFFEIAKRKVNQWFTIVPQYKGEPDYFYSKRKEKMVESYNWFVNQEAKRLEEK